MALQRLSSAWHVPRKSTPLKVGLPTKAAVRQKLIVKNEPAGVWAYGLHNRENVPKPQTWKVLGLQNSYFQPGLPGGILLKVSRLVQRSIAEVEQEVFG